MTMAALWKSISTKLTGKLKSCVPPTAKSYKKHKLSVLDSSVGTNSLSLTLMKLFYKVKNCV